MFEQTKDRMRLGLFQRLKAKGVHEVVAMKIAYANYPDPEHPDTIVPVIGKHLVQAHTASFLDKGVGDIRGLYDAIFGTSDPPTPAHPEEAPSSGGGISIPSATPEEHSGLLAYFADTRQYLVEQRALQEEYRTLLEGLAVIILDDVAVWNVSLEAIEAWKRYSALIDAAADSFKQDLEAARETWRLQVLAAEEKTWTAEQERDA